MLFLLQLKITKGFLNEEFSETKFEQAFRKLYTRLYTNDMNSKYLPPRFSFAIKDLAEYYGIMVDEEYKDGHGLTSQGSTSSLTTISKLRSNSTSAKGGHHASSKSTNVSKIESSRNEHNSLETIKESVGKGGVTSKNSARKKTINAKAGL